MRESIVMKKFIQILAILLVTANLNAQNIFNVTQNTLLNGGIGNQFSNYVINIANGVTLTVDMDVFLQNTTINGGGNLVISKKLTFWSNSSFSNVKVTFNNGGSLVTSGVLSLTNAEFIFNGNATATIWTSMNLDNSKIKLNGNSNLEATSGNLNLRNNSSIIVGDGTTTSRAFAKFNGATLNVYDNSDVIVANYNNYYFNWSNYNSLSNNRSIRTTNNNLNCNTSGKNACASPNVYGPATLNFAGMSSSAVLPVKLSSFGVKSVNNVAEISWTTDAEMNASHFEVERSLDGQTFIKIGSVKSNGNASYVSNYELKDVLKVSGKYYYRLKMVDQDGTFAYSPIRAINAEGAVTMNIYPNPASDYIVINTANGANDKLNIQIFNLSGQIIKQVNGNGNSVISLSTITPGSYVVKVNGQSMRLIKK